MSDLVTMAVDDERCIGGGQCELLAEHVFLVDDDSAVASVVAPGLLDRARAEEIVDRCPSGAVSFTEAVSPTETLDDPGSGASAG